MVAQVAIPLCTEAVVYAVGEAIDAELQRIAIDLYVAQLRSQEDAADACVSVGRAELEAQVASAELRAVWVAERAKSRLVELDVVDALAEQADNGWQRDQVRVLAQRHVARVRGWLKDLDLRTTERKTTTGRGR